MNFSSKFHQFSPQDEEYGKLDKNLSGYNRLNNNFFYIMKIINYLLCLITSECLMIELHC